MVLLVKRNLFQGHAIVGLRAISLQVSMRTSCIGLVLGYAVF